MHATRTGFQVLSLAGLLVASSLPACGSAVSVADHGATSGQGTGGQDGGTTNVGPFAPCTGAEHWTQFPLSPSVQAFLGGGTGNPNVAWTGKGIVVWDAGWQASGSKLPPGSGTGIYLDADDGLVHSLSPVGAPSPRAVANAVWVDGRVLVWGGNGSSYPSDWLFDGAVYDLAAAVWTPMPPGGPTPEPNCGCFNGGLVPADTGVFFLGNVFPDVPGPMTGWFFDLAANAWTLMGTAGAPPHRDRFAAAWMGSRLFIYGGGLTLASTTSVPIYDGIKDDGAVYDPATKSWTPIAKAGSPGARTGATAHWTGSKVFVYGGASATSQTYAGQGGAMYDPSDDAWSPISTVGAPGMAWHSVWTGKRVIVFEQVAPAAYDPSTDTWQTLAPIPDGIPHLFAPDVVGWDGCRMVMLGSTSTSPPVPQAWVYEPPSF